MAPQLTTRPRVQLIATVWICLVVLLCSTVGSATAVDLVPRANPVFPRWTLKPTNNLAATNQAAPAFPLSKVSSSRRVMFDYRQQQFSVIRTQVMQAVVVGGYVRLQPFTDYLGKDFDQFAYPLREQLYVVKALKMELQQSTDRLLQALERSVDEFISSAIGVIETPADTLKEGGMIKELLVALSKMPAQGFTMISSLSVPSHAGSYSQCTEEDLSILDGASHPDVKTCTQSSTYAFPSGAASSGSTPTATQKTQLCGDGCSGLLNRLIATTIPFCEITFGNDKADLLEILGIMFEECTGFVSVEASSVDASDTLSTNNTTIETGNTTTPVPAPALSDIGSFSPSTGPSSQVSADHATLGPTTAPTRASDANVPSVSSSMAAVVVAVVLAVIG